MRLYSGQGDQSVLNQIGTQVVSEAGRCDHSDRNTGSTGDGQLCRRDDRPRLYMRQFLIRRQQSLPDIDYVTGTSDALNTTIYHGYDAETESGCDRKSDFSIPCPRQTPQSRSRMQRRIWMRRELHTKRRQPSTNDEVITAASALVADGRGCSIYSYR